MAVAIPNSRSKIDKLNEIESKLSDRYWRLNNLYWIMDDKGHKVKFKLNAVQELLYWALWWLNVILKSRQHGITTFICIFFLDACLFQNNVRAGIIAHKLTDAKKIFRDKIHYAYDKLPEFIKERSRLVKDESCEMIFENNSGIYVATSMRSGTLQYLHVSEYGWLCEHMPQQAQEIKTGAMETVHEGGVIIIESTAEGVGNDFHDMCITAENRIENKSQKLTRLDYKFHFFGWYQKPENVLVDTEGISFSDELKQYFKRLKIKGVELSKEQQCWYAKKKEILGELIYKEHPTTSDEAFLASIEGSYYTAYLIKAQEDGRIGIYPHDVRAKVYTIWDIGDYHTAIWFVQFIKESIYIIDFYEDNEGKGLEVWATVLQSKPYVYGGHYGPWDIFDDGPNAKNPQTGKVFKDTAAELGLHFIPVVKHSLADGIQAVRNIFNKLRFNKQTTAQGIRHLYSYQKEKDEIRSQEGQPVYKSIPRKNGAEHAADGIRYMAVVYSYQEINGEYLGATVPIADKNVDDNEIIWDYDPLYRKKGR